MPLGQFLMQLMSGLSMGMGLFIVAAGLVLIFGVLKVLNFSHGALYMAGAYLAYSIISLLSGIPGSFWIGLILAPVIVALIGVVMEFCGFRRIYSQHLLYQLLLTFGFMLIISDLCKLCWGAGFYGIYPSSGLSGPFFILGVGFPKYNVFMVIFGLVIFVGMYLFLKKTKWGAVIRAITTDREMANALGHNVPRLYTLLFMLGSFLGGLGGAAVAPMGSIAPGMDMQIILFCFIIVVMGGFGSLEGALVSALIIGLVQSFGIVFAPKLVTAFPFILLTIILIVRPHGLFGKPIRE